MNEIIKIEFENKDVIKELKKAVEKAGHSPQLWKKVGMTAAEGVQKNFKNQGIGNKKWLKNAPSTLERKGAHKRILENSGQMNVSIAHELQDDGVVIAANAQSAKGRYHYPTVHHFGTKNGKIPARPWLGLDEKTQKDIVQIAKNYIEKETKKEN